MSFRHSPKELDFIAKLRSASSRIGGPGEEMLVDARVCARPPPPPRHWPRVQPAGQDDVLTVRTILRLDLKVEIYADGHRPTIYSSTFLLHKGHCSTGNISPSH